MLVAIFTYSLSISCGVRSIAVKSTELNIEKGLKMRHSQVKEALL